MGNRVSFWVDENVLELDGDSGYTTLGILPLNCSL